MPQSMGGGAAAGLEALFRRDREEEDMRRMAEQVELQRQRDQVNAEVQRGHLGVANRTADRLDRTADLGNQLTEIQLGSLSRLANPAQASTNPNVTQPSHEIPVSGLSNTPEGRFQVGVAGQNPNEVFGTIATQRPEDMTPEETFYQGKATKVHGLQSWRQLPPDDLAKYRKEWELIRPPSQPSTFVVPVYDPVTNQAVWQTRGEAVGKPVNPPGGQRDKIAAYESTLDLLGRIKTLGDEINWQGVGVIEGPMDSFVTKLFGTDSNVTKAFSSNPQKEEEFRNLVSELKMRTSFAEGGKQFTGTEKELVDSFQAAIGQHPTVAKQRIDLAIEGMRRGLMSLGQNPGAGLPGSAPPPGGQQTPPPGAIQDPYQQYLQSVKKKLGGGGQ